MLIVFMIIVECVFEGSRTGQIHFFKFLNIFFRLRFGLANAINDYIIIRVVCVRTF